MTGPSRPGQDMALDTRKAIADMDPLDMAYGGHVTRIERAAHLAQLADQRLGHLGTQGMSETVPGAGRLVIGLPPEGAQRLVADQIGDKPVQAMIDLDVTARIEAHAQHQRRIEKFVAQAPMVVGNGTRRHRSDQRREFQPHGIDLPDCFRVQGDDYAANAVAGFDQPKMTYPADRIAHGRATYIELPGKLGLLEL